MGHLWRRFAEQVNMLDIAVNAEFVTTPHSFQGSLLRANAGTHLRAAQDASRIAPCRSS